MDCVNLQLILAGHDIAVDIILRSDAGRFVPTDSGGSAMVLVSRADLERAAPIVEDFKQSGEKGWGYPFTSG
jgi:hypothetical protein